MFSCQHFPCSLLELRSVLSGVGWGRALSREIKLGTVNSSGSCVATSSSIIICRTHDNIFRRQQLAASILSNKQIRGTTTNLKINFAECIAIHDLDLPDLQGLQWGEVGTG
jgi:hypothetical protein